MKELNLNHIENKPLLKTKVIKPHLPKTLPIAVFIHDAGGAFYIAKLINSLTNTLNIDFFTSGPAQEIIKRELRAERYKPLKFKTLEQFDNLYYKLILTGSGWASDQELNGIQIARENNINSITLVDHWVNYRRRFLRGNSLFLPDEIWVVDEFAYNIAIEEFGKNEVLINRVRDPIKFEIAKLKKEIEEEDRILYITEPISSFGKMVKSNQEIKISEKDALNKFISFMSKLNSHTQVAVRVHPSEDIKQYRKMFNEFNVRIDFTQEPNPLVDVIRSRYVVGLESVMLVWALMANKRTFTLLPINGRVCGLPHLGIETI